MRQSSITLILCFLISGFFALEAESVPKYVEFQPIAAVVKTPVGNVKDGVKMLPLITWGGDIATVYGNGANKITTPDSIFAAKGLSYSLHREDSFSNQVKSYLSGETPFLRGTLGMLASASDELNKDPRTKPVVFYQLTWSAGGDALVVKDNIKKPQDLKGKTIALQAYGPHVDYLLRLLQDSGLTQNDVTLKWLPDLTGTENSPMAALSSDTTVDAAFVIIPDALALTSGGEVGTGLSGSVKGAKILLSTKTANRVIADVYAVRSDYYIANKQEIENLTSALIESERGLRKLLKKNDTQQYKNVMSAAALLLLDAPEAIPDVEGLYADCEFVGAEGNVKFFQNLSYLRGFGKIRQEIAKSLRSMGLISSGELTSATTDFNRFLDSNEGAVPQNRFDHQQVAGVVSRRQMEGILDESEIFNFEVFFKPNQKNFLAQDYEKEFSRALELASTYGGAIIIVEGHSDPMRYLKAKTSNSNSLVLNRIKQSAKNLSINRASEVRNEILEFANENNVSLDKSQFQPIGLGISQPNTGVCGEDPCAPKSEDEWRSNMRVVFRLIQVEAEADVFTPL